MAFRLRTLEQDTHFAEELSIGAFRQVIPTQAIQKALKQEKLFTQRQRKLNLIATVWLVIAMNLYTSRSIGRVLRKLGQGLRYVWPSEDFPELSGKDSLFAGDSAISYRRYQLGVRPLVSLFHDVCVPMTSETTPGPSCSVCA